MEHMELAEELAGVVKGTWGDPQLRRGWAITHETIVAEISPEHLKTYVEEGG